MVCQWWGDTPGARNSRDVPLGVRLTSSAVHRGGVWQGALPLVELVNLAPTRTAGILADEMGLGKTIQTISLLSHLACEK